MPPARSRTRPTVEPPARPRSDVYTGLLVLSLLAMVTGTVLLYLDYSQFPSAKPPAPPAKPQAAPAGGAPQGGAPQGAPQGVGGAGGAPAPQGGGAGVAIPPGQNPQGGGAPMPQGGGAPMPQGGQKPPGMP